jgi:hypothetical protein
VNPREFIHAHARQACSHVEAEPQAEYRVTLTLAVHDAEALWAAAARKSMDAPGATMGDVLDVIGPREDPSISECIAMLVLPQSLPGCKADDFWVDSMPGLPSKLELARAN